MGDRPATAPTAPSFVPVCAIGASAGGVPALQTLFRLLPDDLGLAYVVVVHLAPDHPSAMHEILGAATRMPVFQVSDGPALQANCVYVIAPDRELVIAGDDVQSRPFTDPRGRRAPIDMFFRSVAAGRGDGVAVVLTGAGSDGALGVRAIKEAGGIVMVQEPAEAGFPSMPQNAIATGVADVVAPLSRLAERIAEAARSKEAVRSLEGVEAANDVRRIIAFLRTRTGHDFSGYKRSTVLRRIKRRMQVCQILSLSDYANHLRGNPEEAKELLADLLISVTMFFRDPAAYVALADQAIRPLLQRWDADDEAGEFRAWVVGCATGEEAYSLAILLLEEAQDLKLSVPIQIFATDLDEGALATAREGRYPRSIEADVSAERLKRFFVDEGTHYRIGQQVRDLVLFATHSVVREPPFMRLDLITCRNVLIYLERSLQQHVCSIFHYGLKPDGYLFLGTAETADTSQSQFAVVERDARLYRAIPSAEPALPALLSTSIASAGRPTAPWSKTAAPRFEAGEILGASHASALEAGAPPSALVDAEHAVLHLSPTAGRFILLSAGPLTGRLPSIVRPELRLDLKLALDRVFDTGQPTITRLIDVEIDGAIRRASLHVTPAPPQGSSSRAIVFFLDNGPGRSGAAGEQTPPPLDELRHLHGELKVAQEAELAGRARYESVVQELRASNEELQSLNEEYRSTAEELETSKEELQSINEELQTVNAELKSKLSVISAAHNDLQNLTASSEIGTLFLDRDLRIRMFTPRVAELINVTQADMGRPITNFTHRLESDVIETDVRQTLRDLASAEREVRALDGRWFLLRSRPYQTVDGKVEGAVVTFDDITARKQGEAALRKSVERFRALARTGGNSIYHMSPDWRLMYQLDSDTLAATPEPIEDWVGKYIPDEDLPIVREAIAEAIRTKSLFELEHRVLLADGAVGWVLSRAIPLLGPDGEIVEWFGAGSDVTYLRRALEQLRESEERYQALFSASPVPFMVMAANPPDFTITAANDAYLAATLTTRETLIGRRLFDVFPDDPRRPGRSGPEALSASLERVLTTRRIDAMERVRYDIVTPDGRFEPHWWLAINAPLFDGSGNIAAIIHQVDRQTELHLAEEAERRAQEALRESEQRQKLLIEGVPQLVWRAFDGGRWTWASPQWSEYTGQPEAESHGYGWLHPVHPDDREGVKAVWKGAVERGEFHAEYRLFHAVEQSYRWFQTRATPARDDKGDIIEWLGTSTDVDDLRAMQDRQQVMVAELQHRTRNLIAVVRSIAQQTMSETGPTEGFRTQFNDRLSALSRVQGLLSSAAGERITIDQLVRMELDALGAKEVEDRIVLDGPEARLRNSLVQTLALAIHELATNARKYGSLATKAGTLKVTWDVRHHGVSGRRLHLEWLERGIDRRREEQSPGTSGYGRELIERALPYALGARTSYELDDQGVRCTIDLPLDKPNAP